MQNGCAAFLVMAWREGTECGVGVVWGCRQANHTRARARTHACSQPHPDATPAPHTHLLKEDVLGALHDGQLAHAFQRVLVARGLLGHLHHAAERAAAQHSALRQHQRRRLLGRVQLLCVCVCVWWCVGARMCA
jgi:hypothetical protein